jgi:hypothetical protein
MLVARGNRLLRKFLSLQATNKDAYCFPYYDGEISKVDMGPCVDVRSTKFEGMCPSRYELRFFMEHFRVEALFLN